MSKYISWVLLFSLVAAFTSQSLVDLADFMVVLLAFVLAYKNREFTEFFKGFKPWLLWPVWLLVIFAGLVLNKGFTDLYAWVDFAEFKWILTLLSFIYLVKNIISVRKFLRVFAGVALFLNAVAIILFFYRHDFRAAGIFDAVMAFSHNIAPLFCLFTVILVTDWLNLNRNEKILLLLISFSSAFLTIFTYTRGVWIGASVAISVALLIWNYKRAFQLLGLFFLVSLVVVVSNQRLQDRLLSKTASEALSNSERMALWKGNLLMVRDHPVLGVGYGQNKYHLRKYFDELGYGPDALISHAHNQYLQVWAGTGTLGLLCFMVFLFGIFRVGWNGYKKSVFFNRVLLLGLLSALLCFTLGALTEANFNISKNRFLFLMLAGLVIGISEKKVSADSSEASSAEAGTL